MKVLDTFISKLKNCDLVENHNELKCWFCREHHKISDNARLKRATINDSGDNAN